MSSVPRPFVRRGGCEKGGKLQTSPDRESTLAAARLSRGRRAVSGHRRIRLLAELARRRALGPRLSARFQLADRPRPGAVSRLSLCASAAHVSYAGGPDPHGRPALPALGCVRGHRRRIGNGACVAHPVAHRSHRSRLRNSQLARCSFCWRLRSRFSASTPSIPIRSTTATAPWRSCSRSTCSFGSRPPIRNKASVPHPFGVFCRKGGRPQNSRGLYPWAPARLAFFRCFSSRTWACRFSPLLLPVRSFWLLEIRRTRSLSAGVRSTACTRARRHGGSASGRAGADRRHRGPRQLPALDRAIRRAAPVPGFDRPIGGLSTAVLCVDGAHPRRRAGALLYAFHGTRVGARLRRHAWSPLRSPAASSSCSSCRTMPTSVPITFSLCGRCCFSPRW